MEDTHLSKASRASAVCCSSCSECCCDVPPGSCWLSTASAPIGVAANAATCSESVKLDFICSVLLQLCAICHWHNRASSAGTMQGRFAASDNDQEANSLGEHPLQT